MKRREILKSSLAALLGVTFGYAGKANGEELGCYAPDKKGLFRKNKECFECLTQASTAGIFRADKWGGGNTKNGHTHLTYNVSSRDNDFASDVWDAEIAKSFDCWTKVTNLSFSQVDSDHNAIDIVIGVSRRRRSGFGRRGGVLAWAQLPSSPNFDGQLWSMFDSAERWTTEAEESGILFRAVCAHEIGHLLGLGHSRFESALMYPYYDANIETPQEKDDIPRIQKLYGEPLRGEGK